ncbi:MAG: hypothetical protein SFY66_22570 [Oculatellaceae cyanobacterium bins.114]|nr:hypothetical protein [Oculatellaceae cyanobacterium bins.114]
MTDFPVTSRYYGINTALITQNGRETAYLRRRFVPPPERFSLLVEHSVVEGDRLDNLAAQYLGDPEQFWRIADANVALRPEELTETIGRRLRITLPEGIPGVSFA